MVNSFRSRAWSTSWPSGFGTCGSWLRRLNSKVRELAGRSSNTFRRSRSGSSINRVRALLVSSRNVRLRRRMRSRTMPPGAWSSMRSAASCGRMSMRSLHRSVRVRPSRSPTGSWCGARTRPSRSTSRPCCAASTVAPHSMGRTLCKIRAGVSRCRPWVTRRAMPTRCSLRGVPATSKRSLQRGIRSSTMTNSSVCG